MLWTCLHFPDLCLQVFLRGAAGRKPTAVSSISNRPDVLACNLAAERRGIHPGMSIAAALALDSELKVHVRNEQAEAQTLESVATWAGQFSPTISIAFPGCVLLEIGGCLDYFHSFANLLERIETGLRELGYETATATAPTPTAACLLARAGASVHLSEADSLKDGLTPLPLALLQSAQEALPTLHGLGLRTLGDLQRLPVDGIARRFGQALPDEIRRALGELPDPQRAFIPPTRYGNRVELPSPVWEMEPLLFVANRLLLELCGFLRARGAGVTRLELELLHEDAPPTQLCIGLAATRDAEHMRHVLRERLAQTKLVDRVEAVGLIAEEIAPLASRDGEFFPGAEKDSEALTQLVERLRARLGNAAVTGLQPYADHRPELAWRYVEPGEATQASADLPAGARPSLLLREPRPLHEGLAACSLDLVSGPERCEAGWWDGGDIGRDYFVAKRSAGERFWVFRDRQGEWFLHGVFS
jgi:protein ImuB